MKRLKFLKEERARIAGEMNAIMAKCETENRSRTPEEKTKWNDLKKQADDMEEEIRDLQSQEDIDKRSAKPVGENPSQTMQENRGSQPQFMSIRSQVARWIETNKDSIKAVKEGRSTQLPALEIRAVATMDSAKLNAGASPFLPNAVSVSGFNDLMRNKPTFWNSLTKGRTNLSPYTWVNKVNKEGNAQFIGEGVLKPLASFELEVEVSTPKKVAERMKASTEVLFDIDGLTSLIENELRYEVEVAANTASLTGTASATSPAGVTTLASAFTLTTIETATPNNVDAIRAAIAQLRSLNFDGQIMAFINPIDAANMDLSKGDDGHYLLPPFTTADGQTIKGVTVVEDNNIAVGNLLIGDMSKYRILMYQDFFVQWGWENDDFSKNLVTVIGEMRFHQFMSGNHAGAFIYDSFADIKTAILAA